MTDIDKEYLEDLYCEKREHEADVRSTEYNLNIFIDEWNFIVEKGEENLTDADWHDLWNLKYQIENCEEFLEELEGAIESVEFEISEMLK